VEDDTYEITIRFDAADPKDAAWLRRVTYLRYERAKMYEESGITRVSVSELRKL
jgi:hypothetical protein